MEDEVKRKMRQRKLAAKQFQLLKVVNYSARGEETGERRPSYRVLRALA